MGRLKRPPFTLRVLAEVVDAPGVLDAQRVARLVGEDLPEVAALPYATCRERDLELARREAVRVDRRMALDAWESRVLSAFAQLRRRGHLEKATMCRLDPCTERVIREKGVLWVRRFWWRSTSEADSRKGLVFGPPLSGHALAIVEALLQGGPCRPGELRQRTDGLTPAGRERGAWRRAWDRLVEDGLVVPLCKRWATESGRARVARARRRGVIPEKDDK